MDGLNNLQPPDAIAFVFAACAIVAAVISISGLFLSGEMRYSVAVMIFVAQMMVVGVYNLTKFFL